MRNIKLTIEYDGSRYYGWQKQPDYICIQDEIEKALKKITNENIEINGSGRTDKGVHAKGQVASFVTNSKIDAYKFKLAINSLLPKDIAILTSEEVHLDFHARFSAVGKKYKYLIYNDKIRSPINRNYTYHVFYELDLDKIKESAKYLIGTHDFAGFMASGSVIKDTVRTIYDINIEKRNKILEINVNGNGFLYNMVRIIVGTLVDIGRNNLSVDSINEILLLKDRTLAGHTAPPQGLYLDEVYY